MEHRLQSEQYLEWGVIDSNDVTQWTWDRNIDAYRGDNEVLRRTITSLQPSIEDELSFP